jgi:autotransporter passenger strand-loop-strand repeat protein
MITGTVVSSGGTETLPTGATANGTVINAGGAFDLPGLTFSSGGSAILDTGTNILTVTEGGTQSQQTLAGTYTNVTFSVSQDSGIGTLVTMESTAPCFVTGTRIATDRGEVPVECLAIGDHVLLFDGRIAPIIWIGRRTVVCARHPSPGLVWPVRIAVGAFASDQPRRDLLLSPDHAVFVEAVLIPVKYLINGSSITQLRLEEVAYYHVELAEHDVLTADGLPVESYLDTGDRSKFSNGGGTVALHPDFATHVREAMCCAELVVFGRKIELVRRTLAERAQSVCSNPAVGRTRPVRRRRTR